MWAVCGWKDLWEIYVLASSRKVLCYNWQSRHINLRSSSLKRQSVIYDCNTVKSAHPAECTAPIQLKINEKLKKIIKAKGRESVKLFERYWQSANTLASRIQTNCPWLNGSFLSLATHRATKVSNVKSAGHFIRQMTASSVTNSVVGVWRWGG